MSVDIRKVLRAHIAKKYKTQTAAALAWGCSQVNVSQMLSGKQEPSEAMLKDVGYTRIEPTRTPPKPRYVKACPA